VDAIAVTGDVDVSGVPLDASNLALRAARLVARRLGYDGGIRLDIRKGVPVAGGMGGIGGCRGRRRERPAGRALSTADLQELGAGLGADVPFAVLGGTAVGTGRGDELATALVRGRFDWVLVTTPTDCRPRGLRRTRPAARGGRHPPACRGARGRPRRATGAACRGGCRARRRHPQRSAACGTVAAPVAADILDEQHQPGVLAGIVSGSGPTIALLAESPDDAERTVVRLADSGLTALAAHGPVPGARVISH
jgi:4-diphosphocytidyl-2-C-methyl-D-erythritol kinase